MAPCSMLAIRTQWTTRCSSGPAACFCAPTEVGNSAFDGGA